METSTEQPKKPTLKRLHKDRVGTRDTVGYDGYEDVREACERKLAEWERLGIIPKWQPMRNNDWLFVR